MSTCGLALENSSTSTKKQHLDWSSIQPLSLTCDQAAQLITEATPSPEYLHLLAEKFAFHLEALNLGKINYGIFLKEFFALFDDTFFCGLVRQGLCQLRFIPRSHPKWATNLNAKRMNGYANDYRYDHTKGGIKSIITLYEREHDDCKDRCIAHLGTLAHEMIHSFFHIYTCLCPEKCEAKKEETNGLTGHGLPWHRCAWVIEQALKKALGPRIHLSRAKAMGKELAAKEASTDTMPLEELGLVAAEVERKIQSYNRISEIAWKTVKESGPVSDSDTDGTLC